MGNILRVLYFFFPLEPGQGAMVQPSGVQRMEAMVLVAVYVKKVVVLVAVMK